MTGTHPQAPVPRPAHVSREKLAARKATAVLRAPVAREISDTIEREGPRAAVEKHGGGK